MQNRKEAAEKLHGLAQIKISAAYELNWLLHEVQLPMSKAAYLQQTQQLIRLYQSIADLHVTSFNLDPRNTTPLVIAESFYRMALMTLARINKSSSLMELSLFSVCRDLEFYQTREGDQYRQALVNYHEALPVFQLNPALKRILEESERVYEEDEERPTSYFRTS